MYPKSYLLLVLAILPYTLLAQHRGFAVKGGLNLSRDKFEVYEAGVPLHLTTEIVASYRLGGVMEFKMKNSRRLFQMEVLYTGNGMLLRETELY